KRRVRGDRGGRARHQGSGQGIALDPERAGLSRDVARRQIEELRYGRENNEQWQISPLQRLFAWDLNRIAWDLSQALRRFRSPSSSPDAFVASLPKRDGRCPPRHTLGVRRWRRARGPSPPVRLRWS